MNKTFTRIMEISLCAIMALTATGCNNDSGNTNAATSNTTVAVSKDEYETEVTTLAATDTIKVETISNPLLSASDYPAFFEGGMTM